jgi:hypothetical protein
MHTTVTAAATASQQAETAAQAERRLKLHRLDMDMERICYSIEQDIRESVASPREHRLLVAEFGMLDAQLTNLMRLLANLSDAIDNNTAAATSVVNGAAHSHASADSSSSSSSSSDNSSGSATAVNLDVELWGGLGEPFSEDESELELIGREIGDLKVRLGMDLQSPAVAMPDMEKVARYVRETFDKVRTAFDFYVTGTKVSCC